jgi:TRAP-type transport system periplasmic protein
MKKKKQAIIMLCLVLAGIMLILNACTKETTITAPGASATTKTVTVTAPATTAATPQTYNLKFQSNLPAGDPMTVWMPVFASEMEKRTNGKVKITVYNSQALGKFSDHPQLLSGGILDIANLHPIQAGFEYFSITNLPFLIKTHGQNLAVCNALYSNGLFSTLFEEKGFKPLYFESTPMAMLFMRDKKITSLDQLAGLKIRGSTPIQLKMAEALGATAVSIPTADVYMALDRGTVDGMITMPEFVYNQKIYEVVKYCINLPLGINQEAESVNLEFWNGLPPDIQTAFRDVSEEISYKFLTTVNTNDQVLDLLSKQGVDVSVLSAEESDKWQSALSVVETNAVNEWEKAGHPAKAALEMIKKVIHACE